MTVSLIGGRGRDRLTAAGRYGTGERFAGSVMLHGSRSADLLVGAKGRDELSGGPGNDALRAVDGLRDRTVAGNRGRDTAYYDRGLDLPVGCELLRPRSASGRLGGRSRGREI